ncbi:MAG: ABC transporter ATP-binding protein/permease [Oscillospiraceae bacterium]|nr:ABC transporter ATP-binding protein/permease [Oscillospiraceae bacterium]
MKLILKYFKPFIFMAAVSIALLFCQNISELYLPRLMSSMIDTGIIRGGIDETAPRAMSDDAMNFITQFMTEENAEYFRGVYLKTDERAQVPKEAADSFPLLGAEKSGWALRDAKNIPERAAAVFSDAAYDASILVYQWYFKTGDIAKELDITKLTIEELIAADLTSYEPPPMPEDMPGGMPQVPAAQKFSVGTSFDRVFYAELGASAHSVQQASILSIGASMLGITLLVIGVTVLNGFLSSRISTGIGRNLRHDLFKKVQTFSPSEFDSFSTASLITRTTSDVQSVQQVAMMSLRMILSAPIMGVGGIIMALRLNLGMSWIVALSVVLLLLVQVIFFSRIIPKFTIMQKLRDKLNLVARENLTGMLVIRAFGNEAREEERFEQANNDIRKTNRYVQIMMTIQQPIIQFLLGCTTITVMYFSVRAIDGGRLDVGQMMAFTQYVMQIIQSFMMISMMFIFVPQALVSAKRIQEVMSADTKITDQPPEKIKTLGKRADGTITFNNVSFKYQDAEAHVLEGISFTAKAGEMTAFIGSTGSGKSTLINLIPRFYDVTEGQITLDGVDIRELSIHELRENLGYVPQKGILFSGDIASNLSYGKEDGTEEEFREALRVAQAEDFVFSGKEGLETEIAQAGDNVSGGQKQRLSIARALVKKPPVYIFDDSFSALDFKTDAALRRALREYTGKATTLVVAQRISTIMHANQIIVLDAGKIVGIGTHEQLLSTCEPYREIAESQLSIEELG